MKLEMLIRNTIVFITSVAQMFSNLSLYLSLSYLTLGRG